MSENDCDFNGVFHYMLLKRFTNELQRPILPASNKALVVFTALKDYHFGGFINIKLFKRVLFVGAFYCFSGIFKFYGVGNTSCDIFNVVSTMP